MKSPAVLLVAIVVLLGLMAMVGCLGQRQGDPNSGAQNLGKEGEGLDVNRIAFIDNNGDLALVNPDGTGQQRVTGDVRVGLLSQSFESGDSYSWPTWSKDGSRVAFSRVSIGSAGAGLSVQVLDVESGSIATVFSNEIPAPVADGTPHYLYWSPDSRYLSFLAPTRQGLGLFLKDIREDGASSPIALGAPLYYHWGTGSRRIAVHSGDRVNLQQVDVDAPAVRVAVDSFNFRAPALSPDGAQLAFGAIVGGIEGVYVAGVADERSGSPSLMLETQGLVAFAWSPDGSALAVAEQTQRGSPLFNKLSLLSPDGSQSATLVEEQLLAFFWSPVGDNIAWVGVEPASRSMQLSVIPVGGTEASGESRQLFSFSPTGEVFTLLSFFDQYAYSHSIWSPNGTALVVAGTDGPEPSRRNGSGPHGGEVYVVDVSTGEARRIASGKLAVWSWN